MTSRKADSLLTISDFGRLSAQALLNAMSSPAVVLDEAASLVAHNARASDMLHSHAVAVIGKTVEGPFRTMADRLRRIASLDAPASLE